jgi:acyl carrier protein
VLSQVQQIFQDFFDDETLEITPETTANDVEDWDSLAHVGLILEVESTFGVKFRISDVAELQNVGQLVELVERNRT